MRFCFTSSPNVGNKSPCAKTCYSFFGGKLKHCYFAGFVVTKFHKIVFMLVWVTFSMHLAVEYLKGIYLINLNSWIIALRILLICAGMSNITLIVIFVVVSIATVVLVLGFICIYSRLRKPRNVVESKSNFFKQVLTITLICAGHSWCFGLVAHIYQ